MSVEIRIDERLVEEAAKLAREQDREKLAEKVFRDFIERQSPIRGMLDLVGKVRLRDDYDYKTLRAGRNDRD